MPTKQETDDFNKLINEALKIKCEANSLNLVGTTLAECGPPDLPDTFLLVGWCYNFMSRRGGQFKSKFRLKDGKFDVDGIEPLVDEVMKTAITYFYGDTPRIITIH